MAFKPLISPHVHQFSLDTGSTPADFLKRVKELEVPALVCTDHGFMGACREVYSNAKKNNLIPVLGIEAYHRSDDCSILKEAGIEDVKKYYKYGHLLIHAQDQKAYEAMVKKISDRDLTAEVHGSERKPIFTWEDLEELGQNNCTASSGCLGGICSRHLIAGRPDIALKYYERLRNLFKPGNFMVEIFPHKCHKNWVSAAFVTLESGETLKYYLAKKVQTEKHEKISVSDLASLVNAGENPGLFLGVWNRSELLPFNPTKVVSAKVVRDFVANECTDFAPNGDVQLACNRWMIETANRFGDKLYVSDDAHYSTKDQKIVQEVKLSNMGDNFKFFADYHLHTSEETFEYFKSEMGMSESEFSRIIENSHEWAAGFKNFKLEQPVSLPKSFYPSDTTSYLKELIVKHGRMPSNQVYRDRLTQEVKLFRDNGKIDLLPYFFLAEDICSEYRRRGILPGPGRGSAAGTLVNYLLGITSVDPIKHELSLDRFLTLDRIESGKMPDVDLDFPGREILVDPIDGYLTKKFGQNMAQIGTVTMLRVKNSMRDVARFTFGHVPPDIEEWAKAVVPPPQGVEDISYLFGYTSDDGVEVPGYFSESQELQKYASKYPEQWETVQLCLRCSRGHGRHASGFLISDQPIDTFIPLMTVSDVRVTQYTAESVESSGGLKIDLLNLNSLKDIQGCLDLIKLSSTMEVPEFATIDGIKVPNYQMIPFEGNLVDIWNLPYSRGVYEDICSGNTDSVFQLGTNSAKKGLTSFQRSKPDGSPMINSINDVAVFLSLDRPGPLEAEVQSETGATRNLLEEYAVRAYGGKRFGDVDYFNQIIPESYGILVYQEQITKVYKDLTGCSGIEAETFRGELGKKKLDKVRARYLPFIEKASQKIDKEVAEKIFQQIQEFGKYSFNKSHAISYATVTYATAFLKHYFPTEWWCSVLQNAKKEEIVEKFWPYCHHLVVSPKIEHSGEKFTIKDGKIIAPLTLIKGLGPKAHEELVAGMPYADIQDFTNKIAGSKATNSKVNPETGKVKAGLSALNSGVVDKLIISGVMDALFPYGSSFVDKLETFQKALSVSLKKKKPEKIKEKYLTYNYMQVYQHKKSLLEIYSEDLIPVLYSAQVDGVKKQGTDSPYYTYYPENAKTIGSIMEQMAVAKRPKTVAFINGKQFAHLNAEASLSEGSVLRVAVAAYVEDDSIFSFNKKTKTGEKTSTIIRARKYTLNIDGVTETLVKWPDWETNKLNCLPKTTKGCIVVATLSKNRENQPFRIESITVVQEPLGDKE